MNRGKIGAMGLVKVREDLHQELDELINLVVLGENGESLNAIGATVTTQEDGTIRMVVEVGTETINGFTKEDFGFVAREPKPAIDEAAELEEVRELYDYVERSALFDVAMDIERKDHHDTVLWAARRNLCGVKLPTKKQIMALLHAAPEVDNEPGEKS